MRQKMRFWVMVGLILISAACWGWTAVAESPEFSLSSPAFVNKGMMPADCKFKNGNRSPALEWKNPPQGTKSYYLECQDLDANWTHWIIYNIPATYNGLPENIPDQAILADGVCQKQNSFGSMGWGGPSPPNGTHRYEFTLFALDIERIDSPKLSFIKQHTLGKVKLVGLSN